MFLSQNLEYFPINDDLIEINDEFEFLDINEDITKINEETININEDISNINEDITNINEDRFELLKRKRRPLLYGFTKEDKVFVVNVGDFLEVFYFFRGHFLSFEGLCLSIRRKNLLHPETSLYLRNNVQNVWVECSVSFFYNRVYHLKILDYKRKLYSFKKSKWLFLKKISEYSLKNQKKNTKVVFYLSRAYIKL